MPPWCFLEGFFSSWFCLLNNFSHSSWLVPAQPRVRCCGSAPWLILGFYGFPGPVCGQRSSLCQHSLPPGKGHLSVASGGLGTILPPSLGGLSRWSPSTGDLPPALWVGFPLGQLAPLQNTPKRCLHPSIIWPRARSGCLR